MENVQYMAFLKLVPLVLLLSCTYSVNLIHTEGTATDMIDETQDVSPTVSPVMKLPILA